MNIITVKFGTKYNHKHVIKLWKALKRYYPHATFWCYTDNPDQLNTNIINIIPPIAKPTLRKWWNKLALFSSHMPFEGPCLYFDLDMSVIRDPRPWIDDFDGLTLLRDFYKEDLYHDKHAYDVLINSSIMTFTAHTMPEIWDKFLSNKNYYLRKYEGDDRFLAHEGFPLKSFKKGFTYSVDNELIDKDSKPAVRMYNGINYNL